MSKNNEYDAFDINLIPAIEMGLKFIPFTGAKGQLQNLVDLINYFPELEFYTDDINRAFDRLKIIPEINKALKAKPEGLFQIELAKEMNISGRIMAGITYDMEKAKMIDRSKINNKILIKLKEV